MIKEKLEKLKKGLTLKKGENNKKTIENLVIFAVILIITIVAINYIWSDDKTEKITNTDKNKKLAQEETNTNLQIDETLEKSIVQKDELESKLENVLSNIKGVGNVNVLITYNKTSQIMPLYDEDSSTSTTEENDSGGGTRIVNESSIKKEVIYQETDGEKTPITQSIISPQIEGAIVTAQRWRRCDDKNKYNTSG